MLATEVKIRTLMKQRSFIETQLRESGMYRNADPSYVYVGQLYPENQQYFEAQGYDVSRLLDVATVFDGKPAYLFTVKEDIIFSEEEMEKAENYNLMQQDSFIGKTTNALYDSTLPSSVPHSTR